MYSLVLRRTKVALWVQIIGVLLFAVLTAISARARVWLPSSPVPLTLQVMVVVLGGLVLGSKAGAWAQLLYLQAVLLGIPATASGLGGPLALVGPTAGYLWSFPLAAFLAGWVAGQVGSRPLLGRMLGGLAALAIVYVVGAAWLSFYVGGLATAWKLGVAPFVVADLAKVLLAAAALSVRRR